MSYIWSAFRAIPPFISIVRDVSDIDYASRFGCILVPLSSVITEFTSPEDLINWANELSRKTDLIIEVEPSSPYFSKDLIVNLLNSGVQAVALPEDTIDIPNLVENRIFFINSSKSLHNDNAMIIHRSSSTGNLQELLAAQGEKSTLIDISLIDFSLNDILNESNRNIYLLDIKNITPEVAASLLLFNVQSDRADGYIPTIVVNEDRQALGLVYSNHESVSESYRSGNGVYMSRKRGLWRKGSTSGDQQVLMRIVKDCDSDTLQFVVQQHGRGFCHLSQYTCFGASSGIEKLQRTIKTRMHDSTDESYTKRLIQDRSLLHSKIREEADELADANSKSEIIWESADLIYFTMVKCVSNGVSWNEIAEELDAKSRKIKRRPGNAKPQYESSLSEDQANNEFVEKEDLSLQKIEIYALSESQIKARLKRPIRTSSEISHLVKPIIESIRKHGDRALYDCAIKFDRVQCLDEVTIRSPFKEELMELDEETKRAIRVSFENIKKFHMAQTEHDKLSIETMPGVRCSRFSRPIERVGLYVPGGTAILPSTLIMLGVPAMVAGCDTIVISTPPRPDGTVSPEIVYIADLIGAKCIVKAGGAQAVAAMAYGTQSIPKCDKIFGPGNQFVTAAKMYVQSDNSAMVAIDMPAGPSEVLVIADNTAKLDFVAADLLAQAEHGSDSQVILIGIDLTNLQIEKLNTEIRRQANLLPRIELVRKSIAHSRVINVKTKEEAFYWSNYYAPEHLILHLDDAASSIDLVQNAGSVFIGSLTPESCGDYSSGTNHSLPTYGYARMYSGVSTSAFQKYITAQEITEEGLKNVGPTVMRMAEIEGLDAHRLAVKYRLDTFE